MILIEAIDREGRALAFLLKRERPGRDECWHLMRLDGRQRQAADTTTDALE